MARTNLGVVEVQVLDFEVDADSRNEGRREAIVSISHQEACFAHARVPEHQEFDMNVMGLLTLAPCGVFNFHAIRLRVSMDPLSAKVPDLLVLCLAGLKSGKSVFYIRQSPSIRHFCDQELPMGKPSLYAAASALPTAR